MVRDRDQKSGVTDFIKIIPYVKQDGIPSFRDSEIVYLWKKALTENALDYMFLDMQDVPPVFFLEFINKDDVNFFIVLIEEKPALLIFMTNIQFAKAEGHFFFYDGFRGEKAVEIGKYCLQYLINMQLGEKTCVYDVIIGITPVKNIFACRFLHKLGMKKVGEIPNYMYNAKTKQQENIVYSYFSRGL